MGYSIRLALAVCAVMLCIAGGCGSHYSTFEFDALDLAPPQEELSEFLLGQYSIPIPVVDQRGANEHEFRNRFQFDFELYALVRPENKSSIADDWARHEGNIRDNVIRVCRNASVDDLQEPELSTLKARLMDALASQVGKNDVRQLLITEVVSQRL
jgi:flagellar basal body-associated protein FliL